MQPMRILLADDHAVLRSGLRYLLAAQQGMVVVGEAESGQEAVLQVRALKPDLVLLDISMPGISGLDVLGQLQADLPWVKVLVLTMHDDPGYARRALALGARGYVLKHAVDAELIRAIRTVAEGGTYVYPTMTAKLLDSEPESPADGVVLSTRETQVLQLLALGYTNQEIADQLVVGARTVETYRKRLMEKLNLHSRSQLVRYALAHHLIQE